MKTGVANLDQAWSEKAENDRATAGGTSDLSGIINKFEEVARLLVRSTDTCPISKKDGETKVKLSATCLIL
ncbi:hypothetical protein NL676_015942 [Syzygium grande]|nr:hypothetical protein NL676_015942 [Syzygium grande]